MFFLVVVTHCLVEVFGGFFFFAGFGRGFVISFFVFGDVLSQYPHGGGLK